MEMDSSLVLSELIKGAVSVSFCKYRKPKISILVGFQPFENLKALNLHKMIQVGAFAGIHVECCHLEG